MQHKAAPQHAAMAQHQREQPDDPLDARLVLEHRSEMREIHLRLAPGRGLEADLERRHLVGPDLAQQVGKDGITAAVAELTQFAVQPAAGQLRKRRQALAQIGLEGLQLRYPRLAWTVRWRLQPLCDVSTHCLAVELHPAGDGRNADTLAMQFKDHDDLPKSDQRRIPQSERDIIAHQRHLLARILRLRPSAHLGNFQPAQVGIIRPALTNSEPGAAMRPIRLAATAARWTPLKPRFCRMGVRPIQPMATRPTASTPTERGRVSCRDAMSTSAKSAGGDGMAALGPCEPRGSVRGIASQAAGWLAVRRAA